MPHRRSLKGKHVEQISLSAPAKSHLMHVVDSLVKSGWTIQHVPANGRLIRNGQKLMLKTNRQDLRFRLFVYKVTESGRSRPEERRIEITSTYQKGLAKARSYPDIVLGYETEQDLFVGVDSERINHGGPTGNASSFFDIEGLHSAHEGAITILQRKAMTHLFRSGFEFHAFFAPDRLAEYLFNRENIHSGSYVGDGEYSGKARRGRHRTAGPIARSKASGDVLILAGPANSRRSREYRVNEDTIATIETGDFPKRARKARKITPEEFIAIKRVMEANGTLGEELVLDLERRRLKRAGLPELAERIRWISRESVGEGYDIVSFEIDGTKRFIEVKSTIGNQMLFEMSNNEWQTACRLGNRYFIYRVAYVTSNPRVSRYRDLRRLEDGGMIQKTASGWRITLR